MGSGARCLSDSGRRGTVSLPERLLFLSVSRGSLVAGPASTQEGRHVTSVAREEQGSKSMNHGSVYALVAEAK